MRYASLIATVLICCGFSLPKSNQRFGIFIYAHNDGHRIERCLSSALNQDYHNYYIVVIDDASTDCSPKLVDHLLEHAHKKNLAHTITHSTQKHACLAFIEAIGAHAKDEDVIILLEGKNAFSEDRVLSSLNKIYSRSSPEVWLTFGQFTDQSTSERGWCHPYSKSVVQSNLFRLVDTPPSHLLTFKGWLFSRIAKKDCLMHGLYPKEGYILAFMFPMLEMASFHQQCMNRITCIVDNKNADAHRPSTDIETFFRNKKRYPQLHHHPSKYCLRKECPLCTENLALQPSPQI